MIAHLQKISDPVVTKLKQSELNPIIMENAYHSPEDSEVDEASSTGNQIVVRDLSWRSDSVSIFFL